MNDYHDDEYGSTAPFSATSQITAPNYDAAHIVLLVYRHHCQFHFSAHQSIPENVLQSQKYRKSLLEMR